MSSSGISVHQVILIPPARGQKHMPVATVLDKEYYIYDLAIYMYLTPFLLPLWQKALMYSTQQHILAFKK